MASAIVDTSVWIDFFNGVDSKESLALQNLITTGEAYLCPTIYQEILQGIRDDSRFQDVKNILGAYNIVRADFPLLQDTAIDLYRSLRKKGITIRKSNDCLIAAHALLFNLPVLHNDKDFTQICANTAVKSYLREDI